MEKLNKCSICNVIDLHEAKCCICNNNFCKSCLAKNVYQIYGFYAEYYCFDCYNFFDFGILNKREILKPPLLNKINQNHIHVKIKEKFTNMNEKAKKGQNKETTSK
tara:strand:+ start:63 stop:380 length:318 start_codon:yes stop_codon:yes gene_type:complete